MMQKPYLILVPTYNEIGNVPRLLPILQKAYGEIADVLIVDDESPDGTSDWVAEYCKTNPDIHLLRRRGPRGRGHASKAGYEFFLQNGYQMLIEMDADLSHDHKDIRRLMGLQDTADVIAGSRYISGGSFGNYKWYRVGLSRLGNLVLRATLGIRVRDASQCFQLVHRRVFEAIPPRVLESPHFSIFMEFKSRVSRRGFKIREMPIQITDRTEGESKLYFREQVLSILKMIYVLNVRPALRRLMPRQAARLTAQPGPHISKGEVR